MSENSAIGWTDHTFNPWWGCVKVSPGCENCYAETFSKRTGHNIWGPAKTTPRRTFGEKHWAEPLRWNAAAQAAGKRKRVFSASMSDVFEDHPDVGPHRDRLFRLIEATPWLDWQLLTKRPENVNRMIPASWHENPPLNWWQGTSVENQEAADLRIPHLMNTPAEVHFLSCEPLIGPVDLRITPPTYGSIPLNGATLALRRGCLPRWQTYPMRAMLSKGVDWVIVGGESGAGHRTMDLSWLTSLVDQCREAGAAVYVKQDSGPYPGRQGRIPDEYVVHQFPQSPAAVQS